MLNSDRFIKAFAAIERFLRKFAEEGRYATFSQLLRTARESNPAVRTCFDDLSEFADLRNAIVHERGNGHVIAEPNDSAVERLESIASILLDPPKIIPSFQREVFILPPEASIAEAVTAMAKNDFSQLPICEGSELAGLLSANTIARWLGACVSDDIFSLADTPISTVQGYTEDKDNFTLLGRSATLFDVLERFRGYERRGKRLEAILITHNARPSQALMGIITVWDLLRIYEDLG